jgi:hypothetical protein
MDDELISAIAVPTLQACVTGILTAATAGSLAIVANHDPLTYATLGGSLGMTLSWLYFRHEWYLRVNPQPLPPIEPMRSFPLETVVTHQLALTWNEGKAGSWLGVEDWEKFVDWAISAYQGASLGESHWCGARAPFSKGEYHLMLDKLLEQGIIRTRGKYHAQGYELTAKGRAVCGELSRRAIGNKSNSPTLVTYRPEA